MGYFGPNRNTDYAPYRFYSILIFTTVLIISVLITEVNAESQDGFIASGNTLIAHYSNSRVIEIDAAGNIVWEMTDLFHPYDVELLSNGNLLITLAAEDGRVIEVDRNGDIVWEMSGLNYPHDAERLVDGNTLIAESASERDNPLNRVIEVDSSGNIILEISGVYLPYDAERLTNGNTLVADTANDRVIEVDLSGNTVWELIGLNRPYDVERLDNGNTLVTEHLGSRVIEVDSDKNIVWEFSEVYRPHDAERLSNDNILIADNGNSRVIEVDRNSNVVWQRNYLAGSLDVERIAYSNQPPIADAGPDQSVYVDDLVILDGTGSIDPDNDLLAFSWSIISQPMESTATLNDPASENPHFTADAPGIYIISLTVNDGYLDSTSDTVEIMAESIDTAISLQSGWPVTTGDDQFSAPTLGDIDLDGELEIVIGSLGEAIYMGTEGHLYSELGGEGNVYVFDSDGYIAPGWPRPTQDWVFSAPALGDIDGDGVPEIITGTYRYVLDESEGFGEGKVYAWHQDGSPVLGWPMTLETGHYAYSSPTVGDIDEDEELEIVVSVSTNYNFNNPLVNDGKIYVYNEDGTLAPGWPVSIEGCINSSPALGDIDSDGELEIVVSTWMCDVDEGSVYALEKDGTDVAGWPKTLSDLPTTPVLGDVDNDNQLEIVCASWYPNANLYIWDGNGSLLAGWPTSVGEIYSASPTALGDIDSDGEAEIVVASYNNIWAFNSDGSLVLDWPSTVGKVFSSPVIGDINYDGALEVIVGWGSHDNRIIALTGDGDYLDGWPLTTTGWLIVSPAIGDIDGDGAIEMIAPSFDVPSEFGGDGLDDIYVWDLGPGTCDNSLLPWPMIDHDMHHTSRLYSIDTDGDGVEDSIDGCPTDPNKIEPGICGCTVSDIDSDLDSVPDCIDNCMSVFNSDQLNSDGDSIGDMCDECPYDSNNDIDGDGICGDVDNCTDIANAAQRDNDADGEGDLCDPDDDNDAILDENDNCQFDENPDQLDYDNDGIGNVCDTDDDGDGVIDARDQCPETVLGQIVNQDGCSIAQLCPCGNEWKNHGAYVSCVAHASEDFVQAGLITEEEKDTIVSSAGESSCGHKNK
ncbi:MAG: VCBS repeat-containing protein [Deltaproteobacteria bacterium]|nr:VCBS repeat-containing protein [Deltaproteobacteria bacterium]